MEYTQIEISIDANYEDILCAFPYKKQALLQLLLTTPLLLPPKKDVLTEEKWPHTIMA